MSRVIARFSVAVTLLMAAGCSSVYMKGTPLYTGEYGTREGPAEDRVNLWPVVYHRAPATSVLWPLMDFTDDHAAVRPLASVYKLDKEEHQYNILAPLAQFDQDAGEHHVLPFFWGEDHFVAFPLVWWFEDTQGIFPVFWWETGFGVFPLVWYEKAEYCHAFPLWLHRSGDEGEHDTHVLWPLFRVVDEDGKRGWRLWPLAGSYEESEKDSHYRYALWPLCHDWKEGESRTRVAFPVYFGHGDEDGHWWLVVPAVFRQESDDGSLTVTPLWSAGESGDRKWDALLPLYYRSRDEAAGTATLVTPLVGHSTTSEGATWSVVPLLSSLRWAEGEKDLWLLAPLVHARWGGGEVEHHVLPLYYYDREERMLLTPLVSWQNKPEKSFLNLGMLLAHYAKEKDKSSLNLLWPFIQSSWDGDGARFSLFPLLSWRRWQSDRTEKRGKDQQETRVESEGRSFWLFPWISASRREWNETPADDGHTKTTRRRKNSAFPLWYYRRTLRTTEDEPGETVESDFRLLGWLYDYRLRRGMVHEKPGTGPADYVRSRVLWRVVHYERADGDESLDLFPFITWDRKTDGYRKTSFMWRLFRDERTADGGRNLDILFLPILRRQGEGTQAAKPEEAKAP